MSRWAVLRLWHDSLGSCICNVLTDSAQSEQPETSLCHRGMSCSAAVVFCSKLLDPGPITQDIHSRGPTDSYSCLTIQPSFCRSLALLQSAAGVSQR